MIRVFLAFILMPVLEIWLITQVAGQLGWLPAILLVIGISAAGAWLVRREGLGVIRRVRDGFQSGRMPTDDLADGAMIFFASALMLTPGFVTDAIGLALLISPIRSLLRPPVISYFRRRVDARLSTATGASGLGTVFGGGPFGPGPGPGPGGAPGPGPGGGRRSGDVFDIDGRPVPPTDDTPGSERRDLGE